MAQYVPNAVVPSSAPTIALSEFAPASAPLGNAAAFLDTLTASYSAVDLGVIRAAYNRLEAAGILPLLDVIAFNMGNADDSLLNWKGGSPAQNNGGTWGGKGFVLDGVNDFINPLFSRDGTGQYQLENAHLGAYISETPITSGSFPLMGQSQGETRTQLYPMTNQLGGSAAFRVNTDTNSLFPHSLPLTGLWHMGRSVFSGNPQQVLFRGNDTLLNGSVPAVSLPPNSVLLGRAGSFSQMTICGWFGGAYQNTARRAVLSDVFEMMRAHFVGPI